MQLSTIDMDKNQSRKSAEWTDVCLPLILHMPNSTEDVFHLAHRMPLAMSPAILKFFPSLAYLPKLSSNVFQVIDEINHRGKEQKF